MLVEGHCEINYGSLEFMYKGKRKLGLSSGLKKYTQCDHCVLTKASHQQIGHAVRHNMHSSGHGHGWRPRRHMVVNSAGTAPLAGGFVIGIFTSDSRILQNSVGEKLEKNVVPVEKSESEFPNLEFRYFM